MSMPRFVAGMLSAGLMVLGADGVYSQDYPNKTIRIVTSAVGGGNDFEARLVAQGIAGSLGRPLVVENRTAQISAEIVWQAAPDGYTLLYQASGLWIGTLLQKTPYDPVADFLPITLTVRSVNILVVHPSLPVKTVKDLIALAKAKPGVL